ncbi:unnamed protein product [Heligmosomoides polygyrus]|uniref:BRF1 domain-containing protein n=1 Tax=Heligmosomoides polygyrus TaxID=6339 RepID=A0A183GD05_HELPZ|nr:unnamed protein product [Heligmosomoides polygyrus]
MTCRNRVASLQAGQARKLAREWEPDDNDALTREEKKIARKFEAILCDGAGKLENLGSDLSTDDEEPDDNDAPTREEKKIARKFEAILCDGAAASVDVENLGSDLSTDDESDWDHCDGEGEEN